MLNDDADGLSGDILTMEQALQNSRRKIRREPQREDPYEQAGRLHSELRSAMREYHVALADGKRAWLSVAFVEETAEVKIVCEAYGADDLPF